MLLGSQTKNWKQVLELVKVREWRKVYVVCNDFSFDKFVSSQRFENIEKVLVDFKKFDFSIRELESKFSQIKDVEVALNVFAGVGEENFVVIQALLRAGLSFNFVSMVGSEMRVWSIYEQQLGVEQDLDG